jgi:hypothetical protein
MMTVSDEFRKNSKVVVTAYVGVLSQHLPGGTEEKHKKSVRIASLQT